MLFCPAVLCVAAGRSRALCALWPHVPYVHAWVGVPSRWTAVRLWVFWLSGCASQFYGARGVRGWGSEDSWAASLGVGLLAFGEFNFPLVRRGLCKRAGAGVGGQSGVWYPRPRDQRPRWGGGGALSGAWWSPPLGFCYSVLKVRLTVSVLWAAVLRCSVPMAVSPSLLG